jgi:1-aminocyclopropane-1-carboxylate deaminase/D-cysteine desulfhydrase-like pyridoxal-dependent ACC family enzyme
MPVHSSFGAALAGLPHVRLATLPTPLEPGGPLPGGGRLWLKRDDLTGLGLGGNKARKLEFLCGQARQDGADTLVTVGAGQSNHCRMTAAAGAVLGLPVHLVLGGERPESPAGNLLLDVLFGAHLHFPGTTDWLELEAFAAVLADRLTSVGQRPATIPIGGSTPAGAMGFAAAAYELVEQCVAAGINPETVVHTTSSGGTQAGLVAGFAVLRAAGWAVPDVVAIGAAPGVVRDVEATVRLARACLERLGLDPGVVRDDDVVVDGRFLGDGYGVPTDAADDAIRWAARSGGWVLDRVYTGKGFAGLLHLAGEGRWRSVPTSCSGTPAVSRRCSPRPVPPPDRVLARRERRSWPALRQRRERRASPPSPAHRPDRAARAHRVPARRPRMRRARTGSRSRAARGWRAAARTAAPARRATSAATR